MDPDVKVDLEIDSMAARHAGDALAANRARARIRLAVDAVAGVTRRSRVHESGSLRVRFPGSSPAELEAVLVNTAGGMAGGDQYQLDVAVGQHARLVITSAAAEKVYRSLNARTAIDVKIDVAAAGVLAWIPQETILFDASILSRHIEIDLAETAQLLLVEPIVFGRIGMGEVIRRGKLFDRWRVRRAGRLVYAEGIVLDGDISAFLAESAVANGGGAVATVLVAPGDESIVERIRGAGFPFEGEVGVSSWNGIGIVRCCAGNGAALRHDLTFVLRTLRTAPLPRLWVN
jgi:urease accessory protein